jgi:uncharacterized membrane protein
MPEGGKFPYLPYRNLELLAFIAIIYPVLMLFFATQAILTDLGKLCQNERLNDASTHVSSQSWSS